jgi:hypothetical protein
MSIEWEIANWESFRITSVKDEEKLAFEQIMEMPDEGDCGKQRL